MEKGSFAFPCLPSHLLASSFTLLGGFLQDYNVTENQPLFRNPVGLQYQTGTAETGPPVRGHRIAIVDRLPSLAP